jgi:hypothetical protein
MKSQLKFHPLQLNLPLQDQSPVAIPASSDKDLVHALVELLLGAAENASPAVPSATGGSGDSETDN